MVKFMACIKERSIIIIVLIMVSITLVTLVSLPQIDMTEPDPFFHVKLTPSVYWIGFLLSVLLLCSVIFFSIKKGLNRKFVFLGIFSVILLEIFVFIIPRLMYVNKIYTDTYLFVGEVLFVLRNGHVGFGWSSESLGLSVFASQFSLITGISYESIAVFLPLAFPLMLTLYVCLIAKFFVKSNHLSIVCLTFIALNWFWTDMFAFNRQSFSIILQFYVLYCMLKVFLAERTSISYYVILILSYFALVVSHPASPSALIINTFGLLFFMTLFGLRKKFFRSNVRQDEVEKKPWFRVFSTGVIFLLIWLSWQLLVHGAIYGTFQTTINAFYEFFASPNPSPQIGKIVFKYTEAYRPIVNLRLFEALFITVIGITLSVLLLAKKSKYRNIIICSFFLSTFWLNLYVLYSNSWIFRPIIYSLPAFSILAAVFIEFSSKASRRVIKIIVNTSKIMLLGAMILFVIVLPFNLYANTPFSFPPTSYLSELDFVTRYGNGSAVILGSSSEFGYYILLNNASITPHGETELYDANNTFSFDKLADFEIIGTSFRVYVKEGFTQTSPSLMQDTIKIEDFLSNNPLLSKVFQSDSWHVIYAK